MNNILAWRLAFIIMFQNVVLVIRWILLKALPDIDELLEKRNIKKEQQRLQKFYKINVTSESKDGKED